MRLTGNTILITGGTSGIGFELAKQLSQLGNKIILTGRDQARLARSSKEIPNSVAIRSDVSDPQAIVALHQEVTQKHPELNILVNNAGIMKTVNLHDEGGSLEDLTREIDINLHGPIRMVKQFLPHLKKQKNAAIMNVTSGLAFVPLPMSPVYCATKAGLHSFTLSLRVQLKQSNVKVFELAPPATQTELMSGFDPEDMKGISLMTVQNMVAATIKGMNSDQYEIRPGQSNQLKMMSRIAPDFILKQLSKPVDRMLAQLKP